MRCPRCVQKIHRSAAQCPHCGFVLSDLDDLYGSGEVRLRRLSDVAGALRLKERQKLERLLDEFQTGFPQLFFSVYYGALEDRANIRQFGLWLLNHTAYEDLDISRPNDGGMLLLVDLNTKVASISFGYMLDSFLTEEDTFNILAKAHPHLLQGNHLKAASVIVKQLSRVLRKKSRRAILQQKIFGPPLNQSSGAVNALERIRSNRSNRSAAEKEKFKSIQTTRAENKEKES